MRKIPRVGLAVISEYALGEMWFVYLLECRNGKIYTGITTDVQRRFDEHLKGTGAKFTRSNPPVQILAYKLCMNRSDASSMGITMSNV